MNMDYLLDPPEDLPPKIKYKDSDDYEPDDDFRPYDDDCDYWKSNCYGRA